LYGHIVVNMEPQISESLTEGSPEDVSEGSATLVEIRKILQSDRFVGGKKHDLLCMILSELNAIDKGSDILHDEVQVPAVNLTRPTSKTTTFIPSPKPLDDIAFSDIAASKLDLQYAIERTSMLGKLPMSTLYSHVQPRDLENIQLDPPEADDDDVENDNDYSATEDYWPKVQAVSDSDIECDSVGSSGDEFVVSSANEQSDQIFQSSSSNKESNWAQNDRSAPQGDSDSRDEDSDRTEDRTRMHKYLAPYARAVSKNAGEMVKVRTDSEKRKRLRRARNRSSRYQAHVQSGSDVPSQSSGDDDEMSYDDEHYAQAIADWREVLPLERSHIDQRKDEVRAHLLSNNHRTRNDFLESLVDSLQPDQISLTQKMPSISGTIRSGNYNIGVRSPDGERLDSHGATILAKASPPKSVRDLSGGRHLRTWESHTATSRGRQRAKAEVRTHAPAMLLSQRKVSVSRPSKGMSYSMCYDISAMKAQRQLPGTESDNYFLDYGQNKLSDTFFLAGSDSIKGNHFGSCQDGLIASRNEFHEFADYIDTLEESAKLAEAAAEQCASGIGTTDVPENFAAPGRWQQYSTNTDQLWSESSSEVLEVFGNACDYEESNELAQTQTTKAENEIDMRASLTIEEFMSIYADNATSSNGCEDSDIDTAKASEREVLPFSGDVVNCEKISKSARCIRCDTQSDEVPRSVLAVESTLKKNTNPLSELLTQVSPTLFPASLGDFSNDHLSPTNHPSMAAPAGLTGKSVLDKDLQKALKSQSSLYTDVQKKMILNPTLIEKHPRFNNVRVQAHVSTSLDVSGGGLPLGAFDDASASNDIPDENSNASSAPGPSTPQYQSFLRKQEYNRVLQKKQESLKIQPQHIQKHSAGLSDNYVSRTLWQHITSKRTPVAKNISNTEQTLKATKVKVRTNDLLKRKEPVHTFGPCKRLQKRPLARQAQIPSLSLLLRSILHPIGLRREQTYTIPKGRYSDTLTALAKSAGLNMR